MTDALVIDAEGLDRLSCNAKADPATGKKTLAPIVPQRRKSPVNPLLPSSRRS